jgi:hypothetical protein
VWTIQRNPDGTRFYYNKALNASKAQLTTEEQQLLVPELDAYDNDIVMPLRVRGPHYRVIGWHLKYGARS